jgi:hypothetical protein
MKFPESTRGQNRSKPKTSSIGLSWMKWKRAVSSTSFGEKVEWIHAHFDRLLSTDGPARTSFVVSQSNQNGAI